MIISASLISHNPTITVSDAAKVSGMRAAALDGRTRNRFTYSSQTTSFGSFSLEFESSV